MYSDAVRTLKPYRDGIHRLYPTIQLALDATESGRGDTVRIMGGYSDIAHTTFISMSKNNVTLEGVGSPKPVIGIGTAAVSVSLFHIFGDGVTVKKSSS